MECPLGKGEVESSILSCSTIYPTVIYGKSALLRLDCAAGTKQERANVCGLPWRKIGKPISAPADARIIPLHLDGWRCSRCGSEWSLYFHECPNCDAVSPVLTLAVLAGVMGRMW